MATLASVNVGLPRNVEWKGRTVYTGAWKTPVEGPRMVRRLNMDGDGQGDLGGHGGENRAVLVYQLDSYRYWAAEFRRDDLLPGLLGENLTVEGLPDDEVCIGDRYRIGDAVLEVTQPRVTCYRAGLRIGQPRMAALLVAHRRPGFYCRVITEGEVAAGQDIVKLSSGPEGVTVADIDGMLYLPGHPRDGLERALRIPALSPGWKGSLQSLCDAAEAGSIPSGNVGLTSAATNPPPAWAGFQPLRVSTIRDESSTVRSLALAALNGEALPKWLPGQSITVRLAGDSGGPTLVRNYSLSNLPGSDEYRISIKKEAHGVASGRIHEHVKVGDVLDVAAARGTFFLTAGDSPVVLLSAGVGVTPVLSMLHSVARTNPAREVWWLHGARNRQEQPFVEEARDLLKQLCNSHSRTYYTQPSETDQYGQDYDERGRLSAQAIDGLGVPTDADAYICGPATFMDDVGTALIARGLSPARVRTEIFGAAAALTPGIATKQMPPHQPVGATGTGPEVQFARSGLTAAWGPPATSLLEFAEMCDVPARWSCRTGVCHTCETALLSGAVRYDPEPLEAPSGGNILICCAQPVQSVVVDL